MMRTTKLTVLTILAVAALVAAAGPLAADYTYGCTLPIIPRPDSAKGETFDARSLVMFIQEQGAIEIKSDQQKELYVRPQFSIVAPGGRETLAKGEGDVVRIGVGKHPIARASDDIFPQIRKALQHCCTGKHHVVQSVTTLEHGERLRFPGDQFALTLEFVNAKPANGEPVNSHKLVLFLKPGEDLGTL